MPKIYGSSSKYLTQKQKHYSVTEKFLLYATVLVGSFVFSIFIQGVFFHNSIAIRWFFTLLVCITVYLFSKAYKNREKSDNFIQGQQGEKEVLAELSKLPDNYAVFYDVKLDKKYNIDFVVTGPTGIFALEVKSHKGNISTKYIPENYIKQSLKGALDIQKFLCKHSNQKPFVNAVLVYSSDDAHVSTFKTENYITVIHKAGIVKYILTRKDISKEINILSLEHYLISLTAHNLL